MSKKPSAAPGIPWTPIIAASCIVLVVLVLLSFGVRPSDLSLGIGSTQFKWESATEEDRLTELQKAFEDESTRSLAWSVLSEEYGDDLKAQEWISSTIEYQFKDVDASQADTLLNKHDLATNLSDLAREGNPPFHPRGTKVRITVPGSIFKEYNAHVSADSEFAGRSVVIRNEILNIERAFYAMPDDSIKQEDLVQITSAAAQKLFKTVDRDEFSAYMRRD